jgi:hypothetical protein
MANHMANLGAGCISCFFSHFSELPSKARDISLQENHELASTNAVAMSSLNYNSDGIASANSVAKPLVAK